MEGIESLFPEHLTRETQAEVPPKKNELGQDEFLKLMLAQLEHQDPFKPMENGEFVAQMAQFSTVAGIENMDKSLSEMSQSYTSNQLLQSSSLIGRTALVSSSSAILSEDSEIDAHFKLEQSVSAVSFDIHSESGELVHHSESSARGSGMHEFNWNGLLSDGNRAPAGSYTLSINYEHEGSTTPAEVFIENRIASVSIIPGENTVRFETEEGNSVSLNDINKLQ